METIRHGAAGKKQPWFLSGVSKLGLELKTVRWFAKYEGRSENFLKQGEWIDFQFFDSLEDAQAFCEKHAQALNLEP